MRQADAMSGPKEREILIIMPNRDRKCCAFGCEKRRTAGKQIMGFRIND